jgi:dihydroorotase
MDQFSIIRPDDWHVHLRDGAALESVVAYTARQFARAIVMPNLKPPVTTVAAALSYRERILAALARSSAPVPFEPLMTLYLTDQTAPAEIVRAKASGFVHAVKYYPAGATTHSDSGVTRPERVFPVLEAMVREDMPLCVHAEVTDPDVDIFDRERVFIDTALAEIVTHFPELRVVVEHLTTREGVQYVASAGSNVAATITAHHLLYDRNAMFHGGLRPHYYCLPVLKRAVHRRALVAAATGVSPKFFLGTDSAPHPRSEKESVCGSAGSFTKHAALELYAEAFDAAGALDRLEAFASCNGPDFYRLPRNTTRVTLVRQSWEVPTELPFGDGTLTPVRAGERVEWRLQDPAA